MSWFFGVSKNSGFAPKMDGEHNVNPMNEQMDDLGGKPPIFRNIHIENEVFFFSDFLLPRYQFSE